VNQAFAECVSNADCDGAAVKACSDTFEQNLEQCPDPPSSLVGALQQACGELP
jgi:hypothetical protein